ncbi:MAG: reverse transcriptase, partial [Lachnospiraceae bacterium]|nr:reverse transcriptase [Lachnospiraceae bacterium]
MRTDKVAGTEYDKLCDFENLYRAFRLAARGKRGKGDIIAFELDLAKNLWSLAEELKNGTYRLSGYYHFQVHDPKTREIQALYFRDRVVQHSLCDNILRPYFENRLIHDCVACRRGKGTQFAVDRLTAFLRAFYKEHGTNGYILKCDVRKYFDNIDHAVLKGLLKDFPDERVRALLFDIIDSHHPDTGKGLPLGNQSSQWFALYYLDRIDRLIKEKYRIRYYTRYMDDLVLVHEDKDYLQQCRKEIERVAWEERKLTFNEKTQVFPLSEGVDYVGWHFYVTDTGKVIRRLRTSNKRRFKRRLKAFQKQYQKDEKTFEEIKQSLASYNGHLKHGHTWKLRKKIYGDFVLTHAQAKEKSDGVEGVFG